MLYDRQTTIDIIRKPAECASEALWNYLEAGIVQNRRDKLLEMKFEYIGNGANYYAKCLACMIFTAAKSVRDARMSKLISLIYLSVVEET